MYTVICLLRNKGKTIGMEILTPDGIEQVPKQKFLAYKGKLENAIVKSDGVIQAKDGHLPVREMEMLPSVDLMNRKVSKYTIMHEDTVVLTFDRNADKVDIYDGAAYNGYTSSTKLFARTTFTDSTKLLKGINRPEFMMLAPNSITKVRIYVYIEGQDIDNYDFASIGKAITINFGFTKERYIEDDDGINYNGPRPVITGVPATIGTGSYTVGTALSVIKTDAETGVVVTDVDGVTPITATALQVDYREVLLNTPGTYTIYYRAVNADGMNAEVITRDIDITP